VTDDLPYLRHILDAIELIESYTQGGREGFRTEPMVRDAVLRNLEIVGEAVKNLSGDLRTRSGHVPWQQVAGLRDVLIHQYFGVDLDLVWEIVEHRLPVLKQAIRDLIETEGG
jgi:uncharacterized protein with HEPN domain